MVERGWNRRRATLVEAIGRVCEICEQFAGCRGECLGTIDGRGCESFELVADRRGEVDPETGSIRGEFNDETPMPARLPLCAGNAKRPRPRRGSPSASGSAATLQIDGQHGCDWPSAGGGVSLHLDAASATRPAADDDETLSALGRSPSSEQAPDRRGEKIAPDLTAGPAGGEVPPCRAPAAGRHLETPPCGGEVLAVAIPV